MSEQREWRCEECGMLLGVLKQGRLHVRSTSQGIDYIVSLPVTCACRACRTLNEIAGPTAPAQGATPRTIVFRKPQ